MIKSIALLNDRFCELT